MKLIVTILITIITPVFLFAQTEAILLNDLDQADVENITSRALFISHLYINEDYTNIYEELDYIVIDHVPEFNKAKLRECFLYKDYVLAYTQNTFTKEQLLFIYDRQGKFIRLVDLADLGIPYDDEYLAKVSTFNTDESLLFYQPNIKAGIINKVIVYDIVNDTHTALSIDKPFHELEYLEKTKNWILYHPVFKENYTNHLVNILDADLNTLEVFQYKGYTFDENKYLKSDVLIASENEVYFNPPFTSKLYKLSATNHSLFYQASERVDVFDQATASWFFDINKNGEMWHMTNLSPNKFYNIFLDPQAQESFMIPSGAPLADFGEEFNFVLKNPNFVSSDGYYVSIIDPKFIDQLVEGASGLDYDKVANRFASFTDKEHDMVLLACKYNFDFFRRNGKADFSFFFPEASTDEAGQTLYELQLFPNPVRLNTHTTINYTIHQKIALEEGEEELNTNKITVTFYSLPGGIIAQQEHVLEKGGIVTGEFDISKIREDIGFIIISDQQGKGMYQQFSTLRE